MVAPGVEPGASIAQVGGEFVESCLETNVFLTAAIFHHGSREFFNFNLLNPMRKFFVLASILLLGNGAFIRKASASPDTNRVVVMISIDGLAGYYLDDPKA